MTKNEMLDIATRNKEKAERAYNRNIDRNGIKDQEKLNLKKNVEYANAVFELISSMEAIKEERGKVLDELVDKMKSRYFHMVGTQFDNAILEMEKIAEELK